MPKQKPPLKLISLDEFGEIVGRIAVKPQDSPKLTKAKKRKKV
jgi:hypothetical protein